MPNVIMKVDVSSAMVYYYIMIMMAFNKSLFY
jgi:hypothetical protein